MALVPQGVVSSATPPVRLPGRSGDTTLLARLTVVSGMPLAEVEQERQALLEIPDVRRLSALGRAGLAGSFLGLVARFGSECKPVRDVIYSATAFFPLAGVTTMHSNRCWTVV